MIRNFVMAPLAMLVVFGSAWAAPTNQPLHRILLDLDDAPFSEVKRIAKLQAEMAFNMDKGPLYKSSPAMINNNPNVLSDEVIFEGRFHADSPNCRLAIFSDDGCDVWINGALILNNFKKGQHLPSLDQSLHVLNFKFVPRQTYHIRIHYGNTIFTGRTDIDGCTLFAFAGGGGPEVLPLLDIYFSQNGPKLADNEKFTVGSFTVVNINDTDGNDTIDVLDSQVLAKDNTGKPFQVPLKSDANPSKFEDSVITVADNSFIPARENGALNRIRLKDNQGGQLSHITKAMGKEEYTILPGAHRTYKVADGAQIEIGEVDLIKLVVKPPAKKEGKFEEVRVQITKGEKNVKLWKTENKGDPAKLDKDGKTITIPWKGPDDKSLPATFWLEVTIDLDNGKLPNDDSIEQQLNKLGIRGIQVEATYGTAAPDKVAATGAWAIHNPNTQFWNVAKLEGKTKILHGDDIDPNSRMVSTFKNRFLSELGMGFFLAQGPLEPHAQGGRMEQEFTLLPKGLGKERYVLADMARQVEGILYAIREEGQLVKIGAGRQFPSGWSKSEAANDDTSDGAQIDEDDKTLDNVKPHDHIYQIDGPSIPLVGTNRYHISRANFREYVRFKFGPGVTITQGSVKEPGIEGSRGSRLYPWHFLMYGKRANGEQGTPQAYVFDSDVVAAANPFLNKNKEAGGMVTTPSIADKTLSATKTPTGNWTAEFDAKAVSWKLVQSEWKKGMEVQVKDWGSFPKQGGKYTLTAKDGADVLFSIEIKDDKYTNGDKVFVVVFRTADEKGKKNEIAPGAIDIKTEEKQFADQNK